jgi:ubiquitin carboxyl-terminal hydrolase 14
MVPLLMLNVLHSAFPQFTTQDEHGHLQQQDANECFAEVLRILGSTTSIPATAQPPAINASRLFESEFHVQMKCLESEEEPAETSKESQLELSCFLNQEVKYLQLGIKSKLTEELEKASPTLGRDAKYEKRSQLSRLPAYLCIQMVRFFFKEKSAVSH